MDLLSEEVETRKEVKINIDTYIELIKQVSGKAYITISVKPSALGIHESQEYCQKNLGKILIIADSLSVKITLDMEDHEYTTQTLAMYKQLVKSHTTFGIVLQSRLFRTESDIEDLKTVKSRFRICIGIYNEPPDIAITKKSKMKEKMLEYAENLIKHDNFVEFATHDQPTIEQFLQIIDKNDWNSEHVEFQQLMGVPMKTLQNRLLKKGFVVRLYVPFATDWKSATPYLKRRMQNNPSIIFYGLKNFFKRG